MATPTEYYVDPSIAGNSGAGTSGDPYGDLQHALDNITRDTTNGDRINIKAGTDEVLAAAISLATYGNPTETAPLLFQGYTSAAADGGIGGISGAATYSIIDSAVFDAVVFKDLHLHNCGSATYIIRLDNYCKIINCEIDNCTGAGVDMDEGATAIGCYFHNIGGVGFQGDTGCQVIGNYFANGASSMTRCVDLKGLYCTASHNIISVSGTTGGFDVSSTSGQITHNSIFTSGTGTGLTADNSNFGRFGVVSNNLIEGWTIGLLLDITSPTNQTTAVIGNSFYDNGTDYDFTDQSVQSHNESLGATPFAKSGSDTYALRATYWAPVDTGNVLTPYGGMANARGAIQTTSSGGGSTLNMIVTGTSSLLKR